MVFTANLIHSRHLHLFLKETSLIMLMSNFSLGRVLGNAFGCFLFNLGLLLSVNRMENILGRRPTNFSMGTPWVLSFIFPNTFLFLALYRKWCLEHSEVSK